MKSILKKKNFLQENERFTNNKDDSHLCEPPTVSINKSLANDKLKVGV
jgi:hypothetical protein